MTKWEYIRQISRCGAALREDAVLQLLEWCGKNNTAAVTIEEARRFFDMLKTADTAPSADDAPAENAAPALENARPKGAP